jgi:hypothetical protein
MKKLNSILLKLKKNETEAKIEFNSHLTSDPFIPSDIVGKRTNKILADAGFSINNTNGVLSKNKFNTSVYDNDKYISLCNAFGFDNVFAYPEIEKFAIDYNLKTLDVSYYNIDLVDESTHFDLNVFNALKSLNPNLVHSSYTIVSNRKSFILSDDIRHNTKQKPYSAMFAINSNSGYRYAVMVSSWGNDLSIFDRINGLIFKNTMTISITSFLMFITMSLGLSNLFFKLIDVPTSSGTYILGMMGFVLTSLIISYNFIDTRMESDGRLNSTNVY